MAVNVEVAVGAEVEGGETGGLEGGALGAEGGEGFVAGGEMVEDEDAVGVLMATDGAGRVAFDDVAHDSLFLIEQSASLCHRGFWLLGWRSAGETLDAQAKKESGLEIEDMAEVVHLLVEDTNNQYTSVFLYKIKDHMPTNMKSSQTGHYIVIWFPNFKWS